MMKIVHFNSGLGNQIFQYMFSVYLKNKYNNVYGYYNKKWLNLHNGLEIHKVFECELPKSSLFSRLIAFLCRLIHRMDYFHLFYSTDDSYSSCAIYYSGYWQDRKYFESLPKLKFIKYNLNPLNDEICKTMKGCMSVSIHVRRGDYLTTKEIVDLSSTDYYDRAVKFIEEHLPCPVYFIFSDDMEWVKNNIHVDNCHYIDWNKGVDSFFDMYLMSQCKAHIIANSSFSFWGAYLSDNNRINIYPSSWFTHLPSPNIAPENWICI